MNVLINVHTHAHRVVFLRDVPTILGVSTFVKLRVLFPWLCSIVRLVVDLFLELKRERESARLMFVSPLSCK